MNEYSIYPDAELKIVTAGGYVDPTSRNLNPVDPASYRPYDKILEFEAENPQFDRDELYRA